MKNIIETIINKVNCVACGHCATGNCAGCPVNGLLTIKHSL